MIKTSSLLISSVLFSACGVASVLHRRFRQVKVKGMSIGVSCLKRFHHAEFGGNREDQEGEERSRPSGKRAKYMYEHASSFIAESVSPPPPPSYHFRRSSTSASPCPHVYNSCYDRSQDRVDDMQEGEEEQNNSLILTATAVPSKRYINEYFELGARRSYGTSSAMEQDLAGAASGGGSVSPVCESCSAVLEEDDLMQEQGGELHATFAASEVADIAWRGALHARIGFALIALLPCTAPATPTVMNVFV